MKSLLSLILLTTSLSYASQYRGVPISTNAMTPTCHEGKAGATTRSINIAVTKSAAKCTSMGGWVDDMTEQLSINFDLRRPDICGGVMANYRVECIVQ